jgi:hypothetical protein
MVSLGDSAYNIGEAFKLKYIVTKLEKAGTEHPKNLSIAKQWKKEIYDF